MHSTSRRKALRRISFGLVLTRGKSDLTYAIGANTFIRIMFALGAYQTNVTNLSYWVEFAGGCGLFAGLVSYLNICVIISLPAIDFRSASSVSASHLG